MSAPNQVLQTLWSQIPSDVIWAVSARNTWYDNEADMVSFEYGASPNPSHRRITIRYHKGPDLYSVVATRIRRKTLEPWETHRYEGVYADQLGSIIRAINNGDV